MATVDQEIQILIDEIKRLSKSADGKSVKFGVLVRDDQVANKLEALVMTLKSARKQKKIDYKGEFLMQGMSDDVDIIVL